MSDAFDEVQEEYRRQQAVQFWNKYRVPLIAAAVAAVMGVGGYEAWTYWRGEQALASSRAFDAATRAAEAADPKDAIARFEKLGGKAVGGYAVLSRLQEAAARGMANEVDKAVAIYDEVARSSSDPLISGLATLRGTLLTVERASVEETRKRLDPVIAGKGPWAAGALEILAYATWRSGKDADAIKMYDQILAMDEAPEILKRRATEMKSLLEGGLTFASLNSRSILSIDPASLFPGAASAADPRAPGSLLDPAGMFPAPTAPAPEGAPAAPAASSPTP